MRRKLLQDQEQKKRKVWGYKRYLGGTSGCPGDTEVETYSHPWLGQFAPCLWILLFLADEK